METTNPTTNPDITVAVIEPVVQGKSRRVVEVSLGEKSARALFSSLDLEPILSQLEPAYQDATLVLVIEPPTLGKAVTPIRPDAVNVAKGGMKL